MRGSLANLPVAAQWLLIAEGLFLASNVLFAGTLAFFFIDRWLVARRGVPGAAVVQESELVRTLPRKIWEARLEVIPDDPSERSFRRRARWFEGEFGAQAEALVPGTRLRVRFRRYTRPLVMPAK
jgi:hypothetical protein